MAKRIMTDVCMEFAGSQYSIDTVNGEGSPEQFISFDDIEEVTA